MGKPSPIRNGERPERQQRRQRQDKGRQEQPCVGENAGEVCPELRLGILNSAYKEYFYQLTPYPIFHQKRIKEPDKVNFANTIDACWFHCAAEPPLLTMAL